MYGINYINIAWNSKPYNDQQTVAMSDSVYYNGNNWSISRTTVHGPPDVWLSKFNIYSKSNQCSVQISTADTTKPAKSAGKH